MPNLSGAKTWVEINSDALRKNVEHLSAIMQSGTNFCTVVKANAYGHDIDTMVRLLLTEGINLFAVDSIDEAIRVRQRAPEADIFILGYTVPERLEDVIEHSFIQTIYDLTMIDCFLEIALKKRVQARVNLKIETGTNRQGVLVHQLPDLLRQLAREQRFIRLEGVSSHFADAENADDHTLSNAQHARFMEAITVVEQYGLEPRFIHMACSAAALQAPETHHSMIRFGIALYGLWSSESLRVHVRRSKSVELTPVLSWKTTIAQIKDVPVGDYIGYARGFRTDKPRRIAVLPVGYFDGYRRCYKDSSVILHGQQCPIIGIICMNMMMVDVSMIPQARVGDTVTLLGRDGMHQVTAEDLAKIANTINYEIVTAINPLLPRIVV
ncbi:MAG: alanine racemase [Patescibacteria group bacterium]